MHVLCPPSEPALLLILKWGGELTPAGQRQAGDLGHVFRCMYPGGEGEYAMLPGSGFLRLHSTYRHDLKVSWWVWLCGTCGRVGYAGHVSGCGYVGECARLIINV